ncbi:MAG TPA: hypothetical protein VGJ20_07205 [Xanthobacteraceae bacterium]|jgi:hypothetical protein
MMSAINLQLGGKNLKFPTEEQLRCFLLDAAEYFHRQTGLPRTEIGVRALNDPAFLQQVRAGRAIKVRTFESFMRWLDAHWPPESQSSTSSDFDAVLNQN